MKQHKINSLFIHSNRTLMCIEGRGCKDCYFNPNCLEDTVCSFDKKSIIFTNKLLFEVEGLTLQIKRKGCKVKVKVLELSEEFDEITNDEFNIYKSDIMTTLYENSLAVYGIGDKLKHTFPTPQHAIDWVDNLFSLREETSL